MRIKIKAVHNSKHENMIGTEVDADTFFQDGKCGAKFQYQGKQYFLEHTMYEIVEACRHKWVDTGMTRTWCGKCDLDGYYQLGNVVVDRKKTPPTPDEEQWEDLFFD